MVNNLKLRNRCKNIPDCFFTKLPTWFDSFWLTLEEQTQMCFLNTHIGVLGATPARTSFQSGLQWKHGFFCRPFIISLPSQQIEYRAFPVDKTRIRFETWPSQWLEGLHDVHVFVEQHVRCQLGPSRKSIRQTPSTQYLTEHTLESWSLQWLKHAK